MSGKRIPYSKKLQIQRALERVTPTFGGHLPNKVAEQLAGQFDVSIATLDRIRAGGVGQPPKRVTLDRHAKIAIAQHHGVLKKAWQQLRDEGLEIGYDAFIDRFHALEPVEQIGLTQGAQAAAMLALSNKQIVDHRNDRVHFDHTEADVNVVYNNQVARPWLSLLVDAKTGLWHPPVVTFGEGIGGAPITEGIIALLVGLMIGWLGPDGKRYGGIPRTIYCDNALTHIAEAIRNGCTLFQAICMLILPGSPWQNGKVEAVVKLCTNNYISTLPGYLHGLADRWGNEVSKKVKKDDLWPLTTFAAGLDDHCLKRNFEWRGDDGLTPAERWNRDTGEVEFADPDDCRHFFLSHPKRRRVSGYGISFRSMDYTHPALNAHRGDTVEVRYLPNVKEFIDCYTEEGEYICEAVPHEKLTLAQRAAITRYRETVGGRVTTYVKEGAAQARKRAKAEAARLAVVHGEDQDRTEPTEEDDYEQFITDHVLDDGASAAEVTTQAGPAETQEDDRP